MPTGAGGSSPAAGECKDRAGGSGARVLRFPKGRGRAGQGRFQLMLEAFRAYQGGEPRLKEPPGCTHPSSGEHLGAAVSPGAGCR